MLLLSDVGSDGSCLKWAMEPVSAFHVFKPLVLVPTQSTPPRSWNKAGTTLLLKL